jgi:hypothetical protein
MMETRQAPQKTITCRGLGGLRKNRTVIAKNKKKYKNNIWIY